MSIKVLIVDDSAFFRRRIKEILESNSQLTIVGGADNGRTAVEMVERLKPDVITMDYEMPVMDGLTAVREIMAKHPTPILMLSSLTYEGARVTLDALDAGAVDYLEKSFESVSDRQTQSAKLLQEKVIAIARSSKVGAPKKPARLIPHPAKHDFVAHSEPLSKQKNTTTHEPVHPVITHNHKVETAIDKLKHAPPKLVVIGTSTGGPLALQQILTELPADFPFPILIVQHMPGTFTQAFAKRLDRACQIRVKEAENNDPLIPGMALIAPGGMQMLLNNNASSVSIVKGSERLRYKPSVDVTFGSAARSLKGKVLALVLTGMGQDGREGSKLLKREGASVWTQDEQTSVVYGMPMSVERAGYSDLVLPIDGFAQKLKQIY